MNQPQQPPENSYDNYPPFQKIKEKVDEIIEKQKTFVHATQTVTDKENPGQFYMDQIGEIWILAMSMSIESFYPNPEENSAKHMIHIAERTGDVLKRLTESVKNHNLLGEPDPNRTNSGGFSNIVSKGKNTVSHGKENDFIKEVLKLREELDGYREKNSPASETSHANNHKTDPIAPEETLKKDADMLKSLHKVQEGIIALMDEMVSKLGHVRGNCGTKNTSR